MNSPRWTPTAATMWTPVRSWPSWYEASRPAPTTAWDYTGPSHGMPLNGAQERPTAASNPQVARTPAPDPRTSQIGTHGLAASIDAAIARMRQQLTEGVNSIRTIPVLHTAPLAPWSTDADESPTPVEEVADLITEHRPLQKSCTESCECGWWTTRPTGHDIGVQHARHLATAIAAAGHLA